MIFGTAPKFTSVRCASLNYPRYILRFGEISKGANFNSKWCEAGVLDWQLTTMPIIIGQTAATNFINDSIYFLYKYYSDFIALTRLTIKNKL